MTVLTAPGRRPAHNKCPCGSFKCNVVICYNPSNRPTSNHHHVHTLTQARNQAQAPPLPPPPHAMMGMRMPVMLPKIAKKESGLKPPKPPSHGHHHHHHTHTHTHTQTMTGMRMPMTLPKIAKPKKVISLKPPPPPFYHGTDTTTAHLMFRPGPNHDHRSQIVKKESSLKPTSRPLYNYTHPLMLPKIALLVLAIDAATARRTGGTAAAAEPTQAPTSSPVVTPTPAPTGSPVVTPVTCGAGTVLENTVCVVAQAACAEGTTLDDSFPGAAVCVPDCGNLRRRGIPCRFCDRLNPVTTATATPPTATTLGTSLPVISTAKAVQPTVPVGLGGDGVVLVSDLDPEGHRADPAHDSAAAASNSIVGVVVAVVLIAIVVAIAWKRNDRKPAPAFVGTIVATGPAAAPPVAGLELGCLVRSSQPSCFYNCPTTPSQSPTEITAQQLSTEYYAVDSMEPDASTGETPPSKAVDCGYVLFDTGAGDSTVDNESSSTAG